MTTVKPPNDAKLLDAEISDVLDMEGKLLSDDERRRVLSAGRLKATLGVFVVAVLVGLSAMMFLGVTRIFDWLTPSIARDLNRKTQHGVLDLAQSAQIGMVVKDGKALTDVATDYVDDADVLFLAMYDGNRAQLFSHGKASGASGVFARAPGTVHDMGEAYAAWAPSIIEGVEVGRVVLHVSKARLNAGMELRREMLTMAAVGCLVALAVSLLFVNLYIGPILRVTSEAVVRLERTTEAALAAARLKSQFLANMSHEIRTPMNGIVGVIDLVKRTPLSARQQRHVQTMETSARSLLTIIDDILDFSKLEAGKYVIREDDFEVRQLVQDLAELLAPRAHGKGIELVQRVDADVPYSMFGDVDRIKQVASNLVGNAIKFTERGHVLLRVHLDHAADGGMLLKFSVTDTGIGIREQDMPKLFGVFSQVDATLTRKYGGTGLGLAICKRLAKAMGGEIGVSSEPGKGSTFWFTIKTHVGRLVPAEGAPRARDARVLVVSGDEAQRDAVWDTVARWGMSGATAETVERACALIADSDPRPYDVAIVDGKFDPQDPSCAPLYDLCMAEALPLVRLVSTIQRVDEAVAGVKEVYLTKPVRVSDLYNGIVSLLDGVPLLISRRNSNAPEAADSSSEPTGKAQVLVVDDHEINRLVAVELLAELGYDSDVACNGAEAVAKVGAGTYAAVLMDCQMPEVDGYEATRRIRALPEPLCRVPIIALTAHAMAGDRDRVLAAGMDDYTAKPVRARAMERVLLRWTSGDRKPVAEQPREAVPTPLAANDVVPTVAGTQFPSERPTGELSELDPEVPRSDKVIEIFLRTTPPLIAELQAALRAGHVDAVRAHAHKLKGACLSIGADRLAATASSIERAAKAGLLDTQRANRLGPYLAALSAHLVAQRTAMSDASQGTV